MYRDKAVTSIHEILFRLKEEGFEPRTNVYSGPEGRVDVNVYDLTTMDPKVEFVVHRGDEPPHSFDNLTIALVYLFRQSAHIQREERQ